MTGTPARASVLDGAATRHRVIAERQPEARAHTRAVASAAVFALTILVVLAYWATDAPLVNPAATIDPWLYTAQFVNFDFIYETFAGSYYVSRLPWTIPGYVAHAILPPVAAHVALHATFFFGAGLFLFLLVRASLGLAPALVTYATLLLNQFFYNTHSWDYYDGAVTTFVAGSIYSASVAARARSRRGAALGGVFSGALAVAAATTNLFSLVFLTGTVAMYVALALSRPLGAFARKFLLDAISFAAGAFAIVAGCGLFARAHGGDFWYFMDQVRAAEAVEGSDWKFDGYGWMWTEPRLVAPLGVLCATIVALAVVRSVEPARRFTAGALAYLAVTSGIVAVLEFGFDGFWLDYTYYFGYFISAIMMCLGAVAASVTTARECSNTTSILAVALAALAVLASLLFVYGPDDTAVVGRPGMWASLFLFGAALAVLGLAVLVRRPTAVATFARAAAIALVAGSVNHAFNSSSGTFTWGDSRPTDVSTYRVGMKLVDYLAETGYQDPLPAFWYSFEKTPSYAGLQSLYYFGYSYLNVKMPTIDSDFEGRLRIIRPKRIVLLCRSRPCDGALESLRRARIRFVHVDDEHLVSGSEGMWVRVLGLPAPA